MDKEQRSAGSGGNVSDVDGVLMHWHAIGEGLPTVLLEAAIGDFGLTWSLIHDQVGAFTRAVVYDRAGLGWSDSSPRPRCGMIMVQELHRMLAAASIPGPYLFVGHSFSALLLRLFAYTYKPQVAGLILLDPAHEDQFQRFPEPIRAMFGPMREGQIAMLRQNAASVLRHGPEAGTPLVLAPPAFLPEMAAAYQRQSIAAASRVETVIHELENLELTQQQVRDRRGQTLGDLRLTVISHGRAQAVPGMPDEVNAAYEAEWQTMQAEIAAMSTRGKRVIAHESGHYIHHEQPALVVQEIREMVEMYRRQ